ncbi:hypothetical protein Pav037_1600 [Pseudomonas syringae pv. avellanae str. ISPaVe037]|nr:hypothetical protein Pav037_1600 [Pseudomonas syringae pv. avellanae str. ISPaVe037]
MGYFSIVPDIVAGEGENDIQFILAPPECITIARVADWVHGEVDELDQMISCLPIVLRPGESVEKTLPFCVEWVDILDFNVPEKRFDLVACQALSRVCKYAARCFKRL